MSQGFFVFYSCIDDSKCLPGFYEQLLLQDSIGTMNTYLPKLIEAFYYITQVFAPKYLFPAKDKKCLNAESSAIYDNKP
jgi:hypothetical protein